MRFGNGERAMVQTRRVVEFDREGEKIVQVSGSYRAGESVSDVHTLTQDVGYLKRQ